MRRRRRLKTHRKTHHLAIRISLCNIECIQRRIDDANITTLRFHSQEITVRSRHTQHIPKRTQDNVRVASKLNGCIDQFDGRHTHRASGSVDERNLLKEEDGLIRIERWSAFVLRTPP